MLNNLVISSLFLSKKNKNWGGYSRKPFDHKVFWISVNLGLNSKNNSKDRYKCFSTTIFSFLLFFIIISKSSSITNYSKNSFTLSGLCCQEVDVFGIDTTELCVLHKLVEPYKNITVVSSDLVDPLNRLSVSSLCHIFHYSLLI